ncbi:hypothetical protein K443DRAFT_514644 [Laccaria amethystina LaAM-08-1]|uniref:Uncharacterized protein n=1 Tax=Laccaria amethystina LaAM-08-1 TaxID=1095629 RepID=A0A0C9WSB7_9AGAR|nr:hypothetical protein K443DRAFT_514644 [Laccaria amethystina LaAM-08-1]
MVILNSFVNDIFQRIALHNSNIGSTPTWYLQQVVGLGTRAAPSAQNVKKRSKLR